MPQLENKECYKKPLAYDSEACSKCEHDIECYGMFLKYLNQEEKGLWG